MLHYVDKRCAMSHEIIHTRHYSFIIHFIIIIVMGPIQLELEKEASNVICYV